MIDDPDFNTLAAIVRLDDDDLWAQRDRTVAALRAQQDAGAELHRMRQRAGLLRDNGFPEESLRAALLTKPLETVALGHARQFMQLPMKCFVLAGGCGVGKSTAATFLALKRDDSQPGFIRSSELERRGRYDKKLAEWLKDRTSLVLDDVGAEVLDSKGVFQSLMDEVVDRLYAARSTLVITTNLSEQQLIERYGARAWSRIGQRGIVGSCGMRDLRREKP